jgi:hypothetical protein
MTCKNKILPHSQDLWPGTRRSLLVGGTEQSRERHVRRHQSVCPSHGNLTKFDTCTGYQKKSGPELAAHRSRCHEIQDALQRVIALVLHIAAAPVQPDGGEGIDGEPQPPRELCLLDREEYDLRGEEARRAVEHRQQRTGERAPRRIVEDDKCQTTCAAVQLPHLLLSQ